MPGGGTAGARDRRAPRRGRDRRAGRRRPRDDDPPVPARRSGRRLWELPAGLLDVAGEDPLETARRELAEEVGLAAAEWSVLRRRGAVAGLHRRGRCGCSSPRGLHRRWTARSSATTRRPTSTTRWVPLDVAVADGAGRQIVNGVTAAAVLAAHAVAGSPAALRPPDAPWPDRPTRFAAR